MPSYFFYWYFLIGGNYMGEKQEIAYVKRIVIAGQSVVLVSILPVDH